MPFCFQCRWAAWAPHWRGPSVPLKTSPSSVLQAVYTGLALTSCLIKTDCNNLNSTEHMEKRRQRRPSVYVAPQGGPPLMVFAVSSWNLPCPKLSSISIVDTGRLTFLTEGPREALSIHL